MRLLTLRLTRYGCTDLTQLGAVCAYEVWGTIRTSLPLLGPYILDGLNIVLGRDLA